MFKRSLLSLVMVFSCAAVASSDEKPTGFISLPDETTTALTNVATSSEFAAAVKKMLNPFAYAAACKAMYEAGFKGALPTLYADHKPVIAGAFVVTAAAVAAAVAYHNGWFSKAKNWVLSFRD